MAFLGSSSHLMRSALAPSQATVRSSNGSTNCASTLESKAKLVSSISRRALRISQVNIRQRQHGRRSKLVFKILTRPRALIGIVYYILGIFQLSIALFSKKNPSKLDHCVLLCSLTNGTFERDK